MKSFGFSSHSVLKEIALSQASEVTTSDNKDIAPFGPGGAALFTSKIYKIDQNRNNRVREPTTTYCL